MEQRTKIGRYDLVRRLAIGGMGEIFLARERGVAGFDRLVVVKCLIPDLVERADMVTLFIDEARIAANLAHPNIVQIFEFGHEDGAYFLAMEYVPGQNLARICERAVKHPTKILTRDLAVHIAAELAHGLDFAHKATDIEGRALGIVHRDVSPHNLLLSVHGDVKVMDFGIAKAANALHRTETGVIRGKYAYMSPEQIMGDDVDVTTDVYATGVVLWELTLMARLFTGKDELQVLDRVKEGKIVRPTERDPSYPPDLEAIVLKALARERSDRYQSCGELAAELRGWLAARSVAVHRTALGAVVTTLFPDVDHTAPIRTSPGAEDRRTKSLPKPDTDSGPTARMPEVVDPSIELQVGTSSLPAAQVTEQPASPRSRTRIALLLVALLLVGGGVALTQLWPRDSTPRTEQVAAAPVAAPPAVPPPAPAVSVDASVTVTVESPPPASPPPAAPKPAKRPKRETPAPKGPPITSPVVTAKPEPTAAPIAEPGTLAIKADPWGMVTIPGIAPQKTPLQVKIAAGMHAFSVELSENAGTVRGSATIVAGKKTKCEATASGVKCGAPQ